MNTENNAVPHQTRHEQSQDKSVRVGDGGGAAAGGGNAEIHDRTGLYISILALAMAGIALGLWLNQAQIIEAKVQAGVAKAEATSHAADTNARVAMDNVQQLQVQLAAKGIKVDIK
jgi:hypothetical protein